MTLYAIVLLCLAATLGLFLIVLGVRYHRSSLKMGLLHATIAITGFGFLITEIINSPINKSNNIAALLLALAVIGGLMLFALHEKDKPPAMLLVALHAIAALSGLLILILGYQ